MAGIGFWATSNFGRAANRVIHQMATRAFVSLSSIEHLSAGHPIAPRIGRLWEFGDDAMSNSPNRRSRSLVYLIAWHIGSIARSPHQCDHFIHFRAIRGFRAPERLRRSAARWKVLNALYRRASEIRVVVELRSDGGGRQHREAAARSVDGLPAPARGSGRDAICRRYVARIDLRGAIFRSTTYRRGTQDPITS